MVWMFGGTQVPTLTEDQKIDHLIVYIETLKGATFIRNGSEHTAQDAAAHLRLKRNKAGSRIKTAVQFIEKLGSKSSMSGEPYVIKFSNGKMFTCELVLRAELKRLESGQTTLLKPKL